MSYGLRPYPIMTAMARQASKVAYLNVQHEGPALVLPSFGFFTISRRAEDDINDDSVPVHCKDVGYVLAVHKVKLDSISIYTKAVADLATKANNALQWRPYTPKQNGSTAKKLIRLGHQFTPVPGSSPLERLAGKIGVGIIPRLNCEHKTEYAQVYGCAACLKKFVIEWHCFVRSYVMQMLLHFEQDYRLKSGRDDCHFHPMLVEQYNKSIGEDWLDSIPACGGVQFLFEIEQMMTVLELQPGGPWLREEYTVANYEFHDECLEDLVSFCKVVRIMFAVEGAPWRFDKPKKEKYDEVMRLQVTKGDKNRQVWDWMQGFE